MRICLFVRAHQGRLFVKARSRSRSLFHDSFMSDFAPTQGPGHPLHNAGDRGWVHTCAWSAKRCSVASLLFIA